MVPDSAGLLGPKQLCCFLFYQLRGRTSPSGSLAQPTNASVMALPSHPAAWQRSATEGLVTLGQTGLAAYPDRTPGGPATSLTRPLIKRMDCRSAVGQPLNPER